MALSFFRNLLLKLIFKAWRTYVCQQQGKRSKYYVAESHGKWSGGNYQYLGTYGDGSFQWEFFSRISVPCACLHPELPHPMVVQCLQEQMAGRFCYRVFLYSYLGMLVNKLKSLSICSGLHWLVLSNSIFGCFFCLVVCFVLFVFLNHNMFSSRCFFDQLFYWNSLTAIAIGIR